MPIVLALTVLIQACFIETILAHAKRCRIRHEEEQEWVAAARRGIETG